MTSGIRIGTPAATTRGLVEKDMREIADIIHLVLTNPEDTDAQVQAVQRVHAICARYPMYTGL